MKKYILLCLILSLTLAFSSVFAFGCKKDESQSESSSEIIDTDVGLEFAPNRVSIYQNENYQTLLSGLESGETVTYTTTDESVATVSDSGLVRGEGVGVAVVKATSSLNRTALIEITVFESSMKASATIELSTHSLNLLVGDTVTVNANLKYNGQVVGQEISWSSENEGVATVNGGKVTAIANGQTTVLATASYNGEQTVAKITVTVSQLGVVICPDYANAKVYAGKTLELSITAMDGGQKLDLQDVVYTVSDTSKALISGNILTARDKGGDVTVTATFTHGGQTYSFSTDVHVYGKFSVKIYANGELDKTIFNRVYGDIITLSLLNPEEGREVKSWYVDGQKISGNTFKMLDKQVEVVAIYSNQSDDDFASRLTASSLLNDSTQGKASFVNGSLTDGNGESNSLSGYVKIDTPNWSSVQYQFDESIVVTAGAKLVLRGYFPSSAALVYLGLGSMGTGNPDTIHLYNNMGNVAPNINYKHYITYNQWIEVEIPLTEFAKVGESIAGFSISVSSNSYCFIDSINIKY